MLTWSKPERREPGDVLGADVVALGAELVERRVHVDRVPEHDDVDHQPERAELVLLAFAVALAQLAALAVEDDAGELVAALAAVELDQDAPPVGLVVDEARAGRASSPAGPSSSSARASFVGRSFVWSVRISPPALHDAELQRAGEAQQVVPVLGDQRAY